MFDFSIATVSGLAATLIATLASVVGIVISKEIKISEFRQQWIESLRIELSSLVSRLILLQVAGTLEYESRKEKFKIVENYLLLANEMVSKIRLRLNPEKPHHNQVINHLKELEEFINSNDVRSQDEFDRLENDLIRLSTKLLKIEWERVKKGEKVFISTKKFLYKISRGVLVILIAVSLLLVVYITSQIICCI
ncbi:MAG: hypothetical protein OXI17_14105 [Gammaproteobacteria bacterium]|nr:hypothetical protein [Gammaproteobacteria bacterium]